MYIYKKNIIDELKKLGYTSTKLRRNKLIGGRTAERLRAGESVTLETLNIVCIILKCQLSDIIEIVPTPEELEKCY